MITLALSSGFVTDVQSFVVKAEDDFSVEQGTDPKIHHVPCLLRGGPVVAAYAWAKMRGGQLIVEVLGIDDINRIKAKSAAGDRGPWGSWSDQMARKSAVRRLLKKLPAAPARVLDWTDPVSRETPAANHRARINPPVALPEDENALECAALERLRNAADDAELNAAWQQTVLEHQQRGVTIPPAVIAAYRALAEPEGEPEGDPEPGPHTDWLDEYEHG
jgi:recombinational DNA repair protein RecT